MIEVQLLSDQNRVLQHWYVLCNPPGKHKKISIKYTQRKWENNQNVSLEKNHLNTKEANKQGSKWQKARDIQETTEWQK